MRAATKIIYGAVSMTASKPDFAKRQKRLKDLMLKSGLDAVMTPDQNDIFYYTGYSGLRDDKVFMICPAAGKPKLAVSSLENDASMRYPNVVYIKETKDFLLQLKPFRKLGYNERSLSAVLFHEMQKDLKARLEPAGKMLEAPRATKDAHEIEQIKKAIWITGKVLEKSGNSLGGKSEKQIADALEIGYRKRGVSEAFESIVCTGKHAAFVHHKADETKAAGVTLIDTGCAFNGYCSDVTRMFFRKLAPGQKKIYEDVKWIHDEIIASVRADVAYKEIEELQKRMFAKRGYKVVHSFGHGIGLSVHEPAGDVLKENAVLTVEPGIYIKGFGGFRVEDVVLVKKKRAEVLSKAIPVL